MSRLAGGLREEPAQDLLAQGVDWAAVAPPVLVALTALAALLADLWLPRRRAPVVTWLSVAGLAAALAAVGALAGRPRGTFCLPATATDGVLPSCSYVVNTVTLTFQAVVVLGTAVVVLLAAAEVRDGVLPAGETHFLVLSSAAGALTLAASRDLASMVVALEVVSLPGFALVGLHRADPRGAEAALTFFLVSVVSVAVMLYGVSLVYGGTGSLHLDRIAPALADPGRTSAATSVGVLLVMVGFAFKVGAVPFHAWVPDTYAGAPVAVAAYLSVVSKAAGVVGLVVLVSQGVPSAAGVWGPVLAAVAVVTMTVGNVAALMQRRAIRLLAWSSVAQAGYMLVPLGVAAGTPGPAVLGRALSATVAYVCIYAAVNLAAFGVVAVVARHRPSGLLEDYRGLVRTEPVSALTLAFALLCLAGLPPGVAGLWAKVIIVDAAVAGGSGWLGVVVAVNTVIGLAYYLRWTALLMATPAQGERPPSFDVPTSSAVAVGVALAAAVVMSVLPQVVLGLGDAGAGVLG